MKKRHLTPREICMQCKRVARESRMCERTPWTAMGIICGYVLLKSEGFKAQRIVRITNAIDEMERGYDNGELTIEEVSNRLMDKADWTIEHKEYQESDIRAKKGSFQYWLDQKQIAPQNAINKQATRYMLFFFAALMDEYGYGRDRLTRVQEYMKSILLEYQQNKTTVEAWRLELLYETGIVFEQPIDPLTQTSGSMMTGE